jgi:hypothetical protein
MFAMVLPSTLLHSIFHPCSVSDTRSPRNISIVLWRRN